MARKPFAGMQPQRKKDNVLPTSTMYGGSSHIIPKEPAFDPKGVYPNLFGNIHPGPEGNFTPTLDLLQGKKK